MKLAVINLGRFQGREILERLANAVSSGPERRFRALG